MYGSGVFTFTVYGDFGVRPYYLVSLSPRSVEKGKGEMGFEGFAPKLLAVCARFLWGGVLLQGPWGGLRRRRVWLRGRGELMWFMERQAGWACWTSLWAMECQGCSVESPP